MTLWGLSLDQIVGSTEFNNVLFLIEPTILVSLILAIQELSCLLFFPSLYFYAKYTNLKNIVRYHSIGLTRSKLGTFSPTDVRLARTLTLRVYPVLPVSYLPVLLVLPYFIPLEFNLWMATTYTNPLYHVTKSCDEKQKK